MATTTVELNAIFNQAEELVGTWPHANALRNAIYALIADEPFKWRWADNPTSGIFKAAVRNTEKAAREYEQDRGMHIHLGGTFRCTDNCNNPD
jgi:hypothetical protein